MPYSSFRQFAAALCEVAQLPAPELKADEEGLLTLHVVIDEVVVTLAHNELQESDEAHIIVTFGTVAPEQELETLRVMGDVNFTLMPAGSPVLCRNPGSGEIVLRKPVALSMLDAQAAFDSMVQLVKLAKDWRRDPTLMTRTGDDSVQDPQRFV